MTYAYFTKQCHVFSWIVKLGNPLFNILDLGGWFFYLFYHNRENNNKTVKLLNTKMRQQTALIAKQISPVLNYNSATESNRTSYESVGCRSGLFQRFPSK